MNHLSIVLNAVKSYVEKFNPTSVYCAWDMRESSEKALRKQDNTDYKQTRDNDYNAQVHKLTYVIEFLFDSLGILNMYPHRGEADDIMFWLAKNLEGENVLITADTDLLQVINETNTVFSPIKKILFDVDMMIEKYGMHPDKYCEYKCITGDKADNIAGIPGFGNKRSLSVIKGDIKLNEEQQKIVDVNMSLINLDNTGKEDWDAEYSFYSKQLEEEWPTADFNRFKTICEKFNISSILKQEDKWRDVFFLKGTLNNMLERLFA
jgi:5'-3' exonuclease